MKEFVHFLSDMDEKGIGVLAVKNGLNTSSSSGRMMINMIGCLEEWNRETLVEITKKGCVTKSFDIVTLKLCLRK
jgi:DNA invertase Pin-like site-specific DNA recombinase